MDKRSGRLHPLPWTMSHYAYHRIAVTSSQLPRPSKVSQAQSCKDEAVMIVSLVRPQDDSLARITKSIHRDELVPAKQLFLRREAALGESIACLGTGVHDLLRQSR